MNRLFGSSKKSGAPQAALNDVVDTMDKRMESVDGKIRKLDAELLKYKEQMARLPNGPSKDSIKRQALQILQQKKQYEAQRQQMMSQSFNLEQTNFTIESMKSTTVMVDAMKNASKDMKKQMKIMNIDKVENLRDDLEDMMMESQEINEVLSRSYGTPEYLDEADLEAELGALSEFQGMEENPSYLTDLPSAPIQKESSNNAPSAVPQ